MLLTFWLVGQEKPAKKTKVVKKAAPTKVRLTRSKDGKLPGPPEVYSPSTADGGVKKPRKNVAAGKEPKKKTTTTSKSPKTGAGVKKVVAKKPTKGTETGKDFATKILHDSKQAHRLEPS